MCGIAGKLCLDPNARVMREEIGEMLQPMRHRGPDGEGIYLDRNVGLGHLRLSIIDLQTGAEPMQNEDGTVWITFNGEIYNFEELRHRLIGKGHTFRSKTDTEVIIHLYEELGPECVNELRGMFAFAIWDAKRRRLFIARDRVGIKPLYYCQTPATVHFASELKAIMTDPGVNREIDLNAVRTFLSFQYVPGEATLFKSIRKLLPGHYLVAENGKVVIRRYWDLQFTDTRYGLPFDEAVEELSGLLAAATRDHMIADVPVGVLLSGGVDSSGILSLAVQNTGKRVKTFTVGFDGEGVVDERPHARLAAEVFGTDHYETTISADDFWNFLPDYVWYMEEPVCEPPAVALYYVSKLARNHVKVLLSGEGGDEAFAGYPNYPNMMRLERIAQVCGPLARPLGAMAAAVGRMRGSERVERYGQALGRSLPSQYFSRTSGPTALFNRARSTVLDPDFAQETATAAPATFMEAVVGEMNGASLLDKMLYADTKTWLPDDLLVKADKMTMANSVELRVPFLDHRVIEFAASLPPTYKVSGHQTKRILKASLRKALPNEIINRKKAGFPVPYGVWLRKQLKSRVTDILLSSQARSRGIFGSPGIRRLVEEHSRSGRFGKEIFSLLALELWFRRFVDGGIAASHGFCPSIG